MSLEALLADQSVGAWLTTLSGGGASWMGLVDQQRVSERDARWLRLTSVNVPLHSLMIDEANGTFVIWLWIAPRVWYHQRLFHGNTHSLVGPQSTCMSEGFLTYIWEKPVSLP